MIILKQMTRFLLVGGFATSVDFLTYMLLSSQMDITISKIISMGISSLISYFLSKKWTFRASEQNNQMYLIKFYVVLFINFAINASVNHLFFEITGMKILAFITATLCAMIINFSLQRWWVFKH